MPVERVDYSSDEDFQQAQRQEEEEEAQHWGSCPNCGETVRDSDMGEEKGIIKCMYCHNK